MPECVEEDPNVGLRAVHLYQNCSTMSLQIIKVVQPAPINAKTECGDLQGGNRLQILYLGDIFGKSEFYVLRCHTGISPHSSLSSPQPSMLAENRYMSGCGAHASGSTLLVTIINWTTERLFMQSSSLETIAPVKDALCVRSRNFEGEQSLLAVCGGTPSAGTLKRQESAVQS